MKKFMPVFLLLLVFAASAEAQVRWGVRLGFADSEPMIGGDLLIPIGGGFWFNPDVELSTDLVATSANAHYNIVITRDAALWFGAGIAAVIPDEQDLDVGVNLLAGIGVNRGGRIFYAQLKRTAPTDYDSYNTVAVGMRF
jgi:hypothetical protein